MEIEILRPLFRQHQIEDTLELVRKYLRKYNKKEFDYFDDEKYKLDDYYLSIYYYGVNIMSDYEFYIFTRSFLDYLKKNMSLFTTIYEINPETIIEEKLISTNHKYDISLKYHLEKIPLFLFEDSKTIHNCFFIKIYIK